MAGVLAGCRLDAVVAVSVDGDGGGRLTVELTTDARLAARTQASGVDPLGELVRTVRARPGWDGELESMGGGGRRARVWADFGAAEEFAALAGQFTESLAAPELAPLGPLGLTVEPDRLRIDGAASLEPTSAAAVFGASLDQVVAALADAVHYELHVTMPGPVLDTNADRVEGTTAIWIVPAGQRVEIVMEAQRPGRRLWPLLLGGVAAAVVTAVALRARWRAQAGDHRWVTPPVDRTGA